MYSQNHTKIKAPQANRPVHGGIVSSERTVLEPGSHSRARVGENEVKRGVLSRDGRSHYMAPTGRSRERRQPPTSHPTNPSHTPSTTVHPSQAPLLLHRRQDLSGLTRKELQELVHNLQAREAQSEVLAQEVDRLKAEVANQRVVSQLAADSHQELLAAHQRNLKLKDDELEAMGRQINQIELARDKALRDYNEMCLLVERHNIDAVSGTAIYQNRTGQPETVAHSGDAMEEKIAVCHQHILQGAEKMSSSYNMLK
eukprot:Ihof_evm2s711 gene=Ihof_evmTU2s711